jgi:hypothetical protein
MQPPTVQEVGRQITDGAGVRRDEGILLDNRRRRQLLQLSIERIHLILQLRPVLAQFNLGVVSVDDVAIRVLYLLPLFGMALLESVDQMLRLCLHLQLGMQSRQNQDMSFDLAQSRSLIVDRRQSKEEDRYIDGDQC